MRDVMFLLLSASGVTSCSLCFLLQACDLLEGLIPSKEEKGVLSASHLGKLFIFSLMWSIGALMELDDRCVASCGVSVH